MHYIHVAAHQRQSGRAFVPGTTKKSGGKFGQTFANSGNLDGVMGRLIRISTVCLVKSEKLFKSAKFSILRLTFYGKSASKS